MLLELGLQLCMLQKKLCVNHVFIFSKAATKCSSQNSSLANTLYSLSVPRKT